MSRPATPCPGGSINVSYRIEKHPILTSQPGEAVTFRWQGQPLTAKRGETIAAALFANGIRIFGHHP